jgi:endonuclease/exonuclease/phosphatase (EEP) superfamily protein YafD
VLPLLAVTACAEPPLEPREPTPGHAHFRVQTFNVELTDAYDADTVAAVGASGAEIVALQEANAAWKDVLLAQYVDEYPYMLFRLEAGGAGALAMMSIYPLEDLGFHEGPGRHPAWHVLVNTEMGAVQVLNVHLRPMFSGGAGPVDSYLTVGDDHIGEISRFTEACTDGVPTIVLGDFNEGPDGDALEWLEARGFENALPLFHPGQETWRHASVGDTFTETIDHVLFDSAFDPLDAWVEVRGDSDHLPVIAHLESRL